ncbi:M56 family metallopeptidase [Nocardioides flavescens]|uniref:Peptidase family M48 n=1 Tax=Nocardioides flavescens TaxID=2691959 RepID=A0A6L7ERX7_9ACTN|nr:M56 family metallopeptidase [Nocardioides flavescens]MXG88318.1 hypothetical protein [Nocardioides flavescens]
MIAASALVAHVLLAGHLGPRLLQDAAWTSRSPQAAVRCWLALCLSVLLAAALVPLTLAAPYLPLPGGGVHYGDPLGPWPALVAQVALAAALSALLVTGVRQVARTRRARSRQHDDLTLLGRPHPDGYVELADARAALWCLPRGWRRPAAVVVTTGARELLEPRELGVALRHEHRHLQARHHRAVALTGLLSGTFGRVGLFARAHREVVELVELAADDAAAPHERAVLGRALVALSTGTTTDTLPAASGGLAASGTATLRRVRRLRAAAPAPGHLGRALALAAAGVVLAAPPLLAVAPGVEAALHHCAPLVRA